MENQKPKRTDEGDDAVKDSNALIASGVGIGALGFVTAAIGGAVCPLCVVAAPALIGVGAYRRWRSRKDAVALADATPREELLAPRRS